MAKRRSLKKKKLRSKAKKRSGNAFLRLWRFIWDDDSFLSWVLNIVIAFVLIKYIVYPGIGLVLGTTHPVVAVISGSMEHKSAHPIIKDAAGNTRIIKSVYQICGLNVKKKERYDLDEYWKLCGGWYEDRGITKDDFSGYSFRDGFNTGDIIVLTGSEPEDIEIGDVIVFYGHENYPIIHRVVSKRYEKNTLYFTTKGDHNEDSGRSDLNIPADAVIGKAAFRIPWLGWIKLGAFRLLESVGLGKLMAIFG